MSKSTLLISGATGLVATQVIKTALVSGYRVWAISSRKELLKSKLKGLDVACFSNDEFLKGKMDLGQVDVFVQCAYTRSNDPICVATASQFAAKAFGIALRAKIARVINISTRSIYQEPQEGQLNTEQSIACPAGAIGIGKYTIECMAEEMFKDSGVAFTSLRLASVNEVKTSDVLPRPMNFFVDSVIKGNPVRVISGEQVMSYIDPRDIADAIMALLAIPGKKWKPIYNVGTGWLCTAKLLDIAKLVVKVGVERFHLAQVPINIEPRDVNMHAGMDISRITEDTGWTPKYTLEDMIVALYEMKLAEAQA